jgi:hypothetical protein
MTTSNLIAGGCYVARILERPSGLGDDSLPERVLTVSECLTELFPGPWAIEWTRYADAERVASAAKLGISASQLPALVRRMTDLFESGSLASPGVWRSIDEARSAAHAFGLTETDFALLQLGVPTDVAAVVLPAITPGASEGATGLYTALCTSAPLQAGGVPAGWELLGAEHDGSLHSWLCNALHEQPASDAGIRPGRLGLLATELEARRMAALIDAGLGAEPVPWFPALLNRHPWYRAATEPAG